MGKSIRNFYVTVSLPIFLIIHVTFVSLSCDVNVVLLLIPLIFFFTTIQMRMWIWNFFQYIMWCFFVFLLNIFLKIIFLQFSIYYKYFCSICVSERCYFFTTVKVKIKNNIEYLSFILSFGYLCAWFCLKRVAFFVLVPIYLK